MAAPTCSRCRGSRWVRYFSETTDGNFEEAFRLCPCNHEAKAPGEDHREELEDATKVDREKPASSRVAVIELRVTLW
jgi:hypothetical protein